MLKNLFCLALICAFASVSVSCKKEKRPEGMPDIYPVTLKIIQGGRPLEGAEVSLSSDDPILVKYPAGGISDKDGLARLKTLGFNGAPAGKFKATVAKYEVLNRPSNFEEAQKFQAEGLKEESFDLVAREYGAKATTPLTVEVQASKSAQTFDLDVGDPIRESREDLMR